MNGAVEEEIIIWISSPDQLFNAPPIDPFSKKDVEIQGESGMTYLVHQLQAHRRNLDDIRLVVQIPSDQISSGFEHQLTDAVQRYCRARISSNSLQIHMIRLRSAQALGILLVVVLAIFAVAYVLFTTILSGADSILKAVVAAVISLFSWVSLWDPLEAWLFNPLPLLRENLLLRKIIELDIQIQPDTSVTSSTLGQQPGV
jgi:hypothetical protein